jgi:hypothetical protein
MLRPSGPAWTLAKRYMVERRLSLDQSIPRIRSKNKETKTLCALTIVRKACHPGSILIQASL